MYGRKWTGLAFSALIVFTTACHEDAATGPITTTQELSNAEAADVAEMAADQIDLILDDETAANPSVVAMDPSGAISFSAAPVSTSFSWTRERECRGGGMVSASGEGTHVVDRALGELTIDFAGSKTITDCARARGDLVITINGNGQFSGHRHKLNGRFEGLQTNDAAGSFSWVTSDGREGSCDYSIHVEWDPSTHTKTITGTVCDREIDRSVTRDRGAGDDGRGQSA